MASARSIPFHSVPFRSGVPFRPRLGSVLSSSPFHPSLLQQPPGAPSPTCTGVLWIKSGHYHPNLINPARVRFREPRIDVSADVIATATSSSPASIKSVIHWLVLYLSICSLMFRIPFLSLPPDTFLLGVGHNFTHILHVPVDSNPIDLSPRLSPPQFCVPLCLLELPLCFLLRLLRFRRLCGHWQATQPLCLRLRLRLLRPGVSGLGVSYPPLVPLLLPCVPLRLSCVPLALCPFHPSPRASTSYLLPHCSSSPLC